MADVIEVLMRVRVEGADDTRKLGEEAARAASGLEDLEDAIGDVAKEARDWPLEEAADAADELGRKSKGSATNLAVLATGLASAVQLALGFARSMLDVGRAVLDASNELADASARSDVLVSTLAGLRLAAKGSRQDFGELAEGLNALPKRIADAAAGTGEGKRGFDALGISVRNAAGEIKSTDTVLREVGKAITEGTAQGSAVATALGESFGPKLRQALAGSTDGLEGFIAAAEKLGTADAVALTGELQRGLGILEESLLGLGATVLSEIGGDAGIAGVLDFVLRVIEGVKVGVSQLVENARENFAAIKGFVQAVVSTFELFRDIVVAVGRTVAETLGSVGAAVLDIVGIAGDDLISFGETIGDALNGAFEVVIANVTSLLETLLSGLTTALESIFGLLLNLADKLGLSDEIQSLSRALASIKAQADENADAFKGLGEAFARGSVGGIFAAADGVSAARALDTSDILATLGGGGAPGDDGAPAGGSAAAGKLTIDDKLFAAALVEALRTVEGSLGSSGLESVAGPGFDLDRFLLQLGEAQTRPEVNALVDQLGGVSVLTEIEGVASRLQEVDSLFETVGEDFTAAEQALAAQILGVGDSSADLRTTLDAATTQGDAAFGALTEQALAALEAAENLVDAQVNVTAAYREAARQLDSAGRTLFETVFGESLADRQAEIGRLRSSGTPQGLAAANALQAQTTGQIGEISAAQDAVAPFARAAEVFAQAVTAFSSVASSFGALVLGDVNGAISTLASGVGNAAKAIGQTGGAAIGAALGSVVPVVGTALGATIGAAVGGFLGDAIGGIAEGIATSIRTITQLGQIGSEGVAEKLDDFTSDFVAGLEDLPVVLEKVLPAFFRQLESELPPILVAVLPEVYRILQDLQAQALIYLVTQLSNAAFGAARLGFNLLSTYLTAQFNALFGTNLDPVQREGNPLDPRSGATTARTLGAFVGAGIATPLGPLGMLAGAAVGARVGDRIGSAVTSGQNRGFNNFGAMGRASVVVNGFVGEGRDDLARYLQDLLSGDNRFGFSLG